MLAALAAGRPGLAVAGPARDATGADTPPEVWVNLAVVVVLLGYLLLSIANKLVAATAQRRSEIAALRLVGTTPRQIRAMMRREAAVIAPPRPSPPASCCPPSRWPSSARASSATLGRRPGLAPPCGGGDGGADVLPHDPTPHPPRPAHPSGGRPANGLTRIPEHGPDGRSPRQTEPRPSEPSRPGRPPRAWARARSSTAAGPGAGRAADRRPGDPAAVRPWRPGRYGRAARRGRASPRGRRTPRPVSGTTGRPRGRQAGATGRDLHGSTAPRGRAVLATRQVAHRWPGWVRAARGVRRPGRAVPCGPGGWPRRGRGSPRWRRRRRTGAGVRAGTRRSVRASSGSA
ncbi:hypothetical protein SVIOM342S_08721 [Streptomyces violaceorubidus]